MLLLKIIAYIGSISEISNININFELINLSKKLNTDSIYRSKIILIFLIN